MAEVAQTYLGNINHNDELAHTIKAKTYLELTLKPADRQKGRIHAHTASGVEIGIIKSRDRLLHSGDLYQTDSGKLLLIYLKEEEFLVLDFSSVDSKTSSATLVYLGHILGNHHYPIAIENHQIWVELITDKLILEKLTKSIDIPGLKTSYQTKSGNGNLTFSQHSH